MDPSSGRRMHEEFTVVIDRSVEEVFAFVTDLPRTPEWRTTMRQADPLTWQGTSAVGARFGAETRVAGRRWRWVCEVTAGDPPGRFAYTVAEGSVPMQVEYRGEANGEGCRFTMAAVVAGLGRVLGRVVVPVIARGMRRQVRAQVGNLKEILER